MFDNLICAISIICLAVVLVVVLVLKDSLRTYFKSLSWSLGVRSLSLSWSLGVRSLSLGVRSLLTSLVLSYLLSFFRVVKESPLSARWSRSGVLPHLQPHVAWNLHTLAQLT